MKRVSGCVEMCWACCARFLAACGVVTPVSSNAALEKSQWFERVLRTRIGSPFVIEGMLSLLAEEVGPVCGYEANGGFLIASKVEKDGRVLPALPMRDAFFPMLAVLVMAKALRCSVSVLQATLPARFTCSDRIKAFPTELSQARLAELCAGDWGQRKAKFEAGFSSVSGSVASFDETDGLRVTFENSEVIHLRPSGNAPELRCYTEADSAVRAQVINAQAVALIQGWKV